MPTVDLISMTPNYMALLECACKQPYGKDVTEKSIKKIIESGHLSVLEHCYASFLVTCSVRVLGQLTRHRHLSFTCKSARGSRFDTLVNPYTLESVPLGDFNVGRTYNSALNDTDTKEEQAAYFLPQGVETSLVVTGNFRAWYEYLPKRLCKRAMPEHRKLAELIQERLADAAPEIFDKNFMNCKKCTERSCDFK
jgi:thymidylate synthase (FAD)|nr:MAG TPA: Thymidylate synthase complementing protein [Bacteriophage sp.]